MNDRIDNCNFEAGAAPESMSISHAELVAAPVSRPEPVGEEIVMNTEVEMISVEKAKTMLGHEPTHGQAALLAVIIDREEMCKRLIDENHNLRNEYSGYRAETTAIMNAQRKENADLRDRLDGDMRNIFNRQTKALERIADQLKFMGR